MKGSTILALAALLCAGASSAAELVPGKLDLYGEVRVAGLYNHYAPRKGRGLDYEESRLAVSSVQLGLEARVTGNVSAHAVLAWNDTLDSAEFDEASVTARFNHLTIQAGRLYLPFGDFTTELVSNTMPQFLGEARETAVVATITPFEQLSFGGYAFGGEAKKVNAAGVVQTDQVNDFGFMASVSPVQGFTAGAGYVSDLADSDVQITINKNYLRKVAGGDLWARFKVGPVHGGAELLGALDEFDIRDIAGAKKDSKPLAWHTEAAFEAPMDFTFAVVVEGSRQWYDAPELRLGGVLTWRPESNLSLSAEYLNSLYDKAYSKKLHRDDAVTLQLAAYF